MLDYVVDKISEIGINEIIIVSNNKYHQHFIDRAKEQTHRPDITFQVLNDNTMSNDDRLWAIGDINFAIQWLELDDDLLVIGSDNIFKFDLKAAYQRFKDTNKTTIIGYDVKELELAKKYGIIDIDKNNKVLEFLEKPEDPPSTLAAICVYFYPKAVLPKIAEYLAEGENYLKPEQFKKRKDAPGNFPSRLLEFDDVYAQIHDEARYDVGGFESLKSAKEDFWEKDVDIERLKKWML